MNYSIIYAKNAFLMRKLVVRNGFASIHTAAASDPSHWQVSFECYSHIKGGWQDVLSDVITKGHSFLESAEV